MTAKVLPTWRGWTGDGYPVDTGQRAAQAVHVAGPEANEGLRHEHPGVCCAIFRTQLVLRTHLLRALDRVGEDDSHGEHW